MMLDDWNERMDLNAEMRNVGFTKVMICKDWREYRAVLNSERVEFPMYLLVKPFENAKAYTKHGWLVVGEPIPHGYFKCRYCKTVGEQNTVCATCGARVQSDWERYLEKYYGRDMVAE